MMKTETTMSQDDKAKSPLVDSGERTTFCTGAMKEITEDKGRCDLLPLDVISDLLIHHKNHSYEGQENRSSLMILDLINEFIYKGDTTNLIMSICLFIDCVYPNIYEGILELSKHYRDGALKYEDRNWEKGIPLHNFIDSAVRHFLKYLRGDNDEPHDRAFMWNLVCCIETFDRVSSGKLPKELFDLPFQQ